LERVNRAEGEAEMKEPHRISVRIGVLLVPGALASSGCGNEDLPLPDVTEQALANRAYVVSRDTDLLTVIDLDKLEIVGNVRTQGAFTHMAELNADFTKVYLSSTLTDEAVVVDTRALEVTGRIEVGAEPAHMTLSNDGRLLAVGNEGGGSVSFIDPDNDMEVERLTGVYFPKFIRFDPDGRYAYVANGNAHHISRVELTSFAIDDQISLDGFGMPTMTDEEEGGFADVQIDHNGMLWAAHAQTGRVLVYDTKAKSKATELSAGVGPWVVYAQHPFGAAIPRHYVPNHGDRTVSVLDKTELAVVGEVPGDPESFGVNYSPLVPDLAFIMNRMEEDVAVVNTETQEVIDRISVGGMTETAATTADGRYIVATVSSINRVVVIDPKLRTVIKTFDNVGQYPWSVTIPLGQNYCH
jgi:DNA-binding beta-propeller fold protein YncE